MSGWRDEIDQAEHDYWRNWCPACDHSPCIAGRRGACLDRERPVTPAVAARYRPERARL